MITPDYSIIIPTHNKRDDVQVCLNAVLAQDRGGRQIEIIVIDDGSADGTGAALDRYDSKGTPFRYVRLAGHGPARARNEGIRHAQGRIVCMVDDDAVPQAGWLQALVRPFESNPDLVGVEGKVIPTGPDFGPLGMSPRNERGGVFLTCNIAYRRDVLLRIGGFDEGFPFPAFEDTDLATAACEHGRIAWAPDAVVHHPRRRWTLERAIREIRFYRALLRYAVRYRALGWQARPTRFPVARTVWSAVVALPAGRVLRGIRNLPRYPRESIEFIGISLAQGAAAAVLIWPQVFATLREPNPTRHSSLTLRDGSTPVTALS